MSYSYFLFRACFVGTNANIFPKQCTAVWMFHFLPATHINVHVIQSLRHALKCPCHT